MEEAKAEEVRESIARSEWHENGRARTHTHGTQIEHKDSGVQAGRARARHSGVVVGVTRRFVGWGCNFKHCFF